MSDSKVMTPDRVNVFFKRTFNVAKYESLELSVGLGVDKREDETVDQCFKRVVGDTLPKFENLMSAVERGKVKGIDKKEKWIR